MIIESPAQTDLHSTSMFEKSTAVDPPAYSLIDDDDELRENGSGSPPFRLIHGNGSSGSRRGHRGCGRGGRGGRVAPLPHRHARHADFVQKSMPLPSPSVDQVHIHDRKHNIVGTFHIDPEIPMLDPSKRQKGKSNAPFPHASFRTKDSGIDLHLGTTGDARKVAKANVHVGSKDGFMKVTLLPFAPTRPRIGLDMSSRQGTIVLFIPQNYVGVIDIDSHKGKINILPCLTRQMKVVRSREHDQMITVGNADESCSDNINEVSYCKISSRSGDVVVGVDGLDRYVAPVGFWKRLFGKSSGDQSSEYAT